MKLRIRWHRPSQELAQTPTTPKENKDVKKERSAEDSAIADYKEEMVHYSRLVEIKHNELKRIEKNEPLLYKQFAGDVDKLDKVYHSLGRPIAKKSQPRTIIGSNDPEFTTADEITESPARHY